MRRRPKVVVIAKVVAALMLVGALAQNPYSYYTLMRWVVCGVSGFSAYRAAELKKAGWAWTLGIVALIFNPILPVHLDRGIWAFVDLGVAVLLLVSIPAVERWGCQSHGTDRPPHHQNKRCPARSVEINSRMMMPIKIKPM